MNALVFKDFGDASKVLSFQNLEKPTIKSNELLIKVFASPINPSDLLQINGIYPIRPCKENELYIPGNEGSGVVVDVGSDIKDLQKGDHIIIAGAAVGTWRTHLTVTRDQIIKANNDLDLRHAAILSINPTTAFRMLKDFGTHKAVIQSAANSNVGRMVIQMARLLGMKTINIVRDRKDIELLRNELTDLGADYVFTDKELATKDTFAKISELKPTLALDPVSGEVAGNMANTLDRNGILVSYGSMTQTPVPVSAAILIFKNISFKGFWIASWFMTHSNEEKTQMFNEIEQMVLSGKVAIPNLREYPISEYKTAFEKGDKAIFIL